MHAVSIADVSHRFEGAWVLAHLSLEIPRGGRVLLTGGNGSGKTTLLRLMATALRPRRGDIRIFGASTRTEARAARHRLALMTHQHYFYEALSARTNLQLVAQLSGRGDGQQIDQLLQRVGLARQARAPVSTFSAGMQRRLALARVLLLQPDLVLLDEPFSQLDDSGVAFVEGVLTEMASRGISWVMSTHDIERGRKLCSMQVALGGEGRPAVVRPLAPPKEAL